MRTASPPATPSPAAKSFTAGSEGGASMSHPIEQLARPNVVPIKPYVPGKPVGEVVREYGVERVVKLASNESSMPPSPAAVAAMHEVIHDHPHVPGLRQLRPEACARSTLGRGQRALRGVQRGRRGIAAAGDGVPRARRRGGLRLAHLRQLRAHGEVDERRGRTGPLEGLHLRPGCHGGCGDAADEDGHRLQPQQPHGHVRHRCRAQGVREATAGAPPCLARRGLRRVRRRALVPRLLSSCRP